MASIVQSGFPYEIESFQVVNLRTGVRNDAWALEGYLENALDEATSVHWHGMHLPARCDGGPSHVRDRPCDGILRWQRKGRVLRVRAGRQISRSSDGR